MALYRGYSRLYRQLHRAARRRRIVIDCLSEAHYFHIEPVLQRLAEDASNDVSVLAIDGSKATLPERVATISRRGLKATAFRPIDLYISLDLNEPPWWLGEAEVAFFLHGVGTKVNYFATPKLSRFDVVFAPSPFVEEKQRPFLRPGATLLPAGLPALDRFASVPSRRYRQGPPLLLYAPSWSNDRDQISASPAIIDALIEQEICDVVIRPHPLLVDDKVGVPNLKEAIASAPLRNPRVRLLTGLGTSIYDVISDADILMSDISSVLYEFLVFDRPIILGLKETVAGFYEAEGIIAQTRDACIELAEAGHLEEAVRTCLKEGDARSAMRGRLLGRMLHNPLNATPVMVDQIKKLLEDR